MNPLSPRIGTHSGRFTRPRGRAGKSTSNSHRNRTLILNQASAQSQSTNKNTEAVEGPNKSGSEFDNETIQSPNVQSGWIAKHDRHMQLINSSIFEKQSQVRSKAMDQTRQQKALQKDQREKLKIERYLQTVSNPTIHTSTAPSTNAITNVHEISVNGLSFRVVDGGSKLLRIRSGIHVLGLDLLISADVD